MRSYPGPLAARVPLSKPIRSRVPLTFMRLRMSLKQPRYCQFSFPWETFGQQRRHEWAGERSLPDQISRPSVGSMATTVRGGQSLRKVSFAMTEKARIARTKRRPIVRAIVNATKINFFPFVTL
jgi:hypothetical protein